MNFKWGKGSLLFFAIRVCVVDSVPHLVISQDPQEQVIPGQEIEVELSHFPMDSDENGIKSGPTPR